MEWSDKQVMRDIISTCILATQGWEKIVEEQEPLDFADRLVERFTIPLEGGEADCAKNFSLCCITLCISLLYQLLRSCLVANL